MMMEDPVRLLEGGTENPLLHRALEAGRSDLPDFSRLAAIAAQIGIAAGASGGTAAAATGLSLGAKLAAIALTISAMTGGGWLAARHFRARTTPAPPVEAQPPPGPPLPLPEPPPLELPAPGPSQLQPKLSAPAQRAMNHFPTLAADPAAEVALLQEAQDALRTSPDHALGLCELHGRRFPAGSLAQEREVISIEALLSLDRRDEAEARAERFRLNYPNSGHLRRIEQVLSQ